VVVEWGLDEWRWLSSGSGSDGSVEGNLSAALAVRAVELRWIGGGTVGGLAVDWWWRG
jgi:hypothetical protein